MALGIVLLSVEEAAAEKSCPDKKWRTFNQAPVSTEGNLEARGEPEGSSPGRTKDIQLCNRWSKQTTYLRELQEKQWQLDLGSSN